VTAKTDFWDRPDYDVWYKFGIRIKNSDGVAGSWVYTTLTKMNAATGFDPTGMDPTKLGDTLVLADGKLSNYALTYLSKWGLSGDDFDTSLGNVIIKTAVMDRLLARSATITSDLTITRSSSGGVVTINGDGVTVSKGTSSVAVGSSSVAITGGGTTATISSTGLSINTVITDAVSVYYSLLEKHRLDYNGVVLYGPFNHTGTTVSLSSPSTWRSALGLVIGTNVAAESHNHDAAYAAKRSITAGSITLAKITAGGTDGSITFAADGTVTAYTAPT
jgi:hypothetical protein